MATDKGAGGPAKNNSNGQHVAKKQRVQAAPVPSLEATLLIKHDLGFSTQPSPGPVHGCRVAAQEVPGGSACQVFVAAGSSMYTVAVPLTLHPNSQIQKGKEGVLIPSGVQADGSLMQLESGLAELQNITLAQHGAHTYLAAVDSYGRALIQRMQIDEGQGISFQDSLSLEPQYHRESGWSGISLSPCQGGADGAINSVVARHFARDVQLYQNDTPVRALHTVQCPTAVQHLPQLSASDANILAVAEEHQVSLWDVRQGETGGCIQRLTVSPAGCSNLCLKWCPADGGLLACGGSERSLVMLDPRKWRPAHKWSGCLKYNIHQVEFAEACPRYALLAGLDNECICARWDRSSVGPSSGNMNSITGGHGRAVGPAHLLGNTQPPPQAAEEEEAQAGAAIASEGGFSFRGESRWLGMCKTQGRDLVVAYSQGGLVYVADMRVKEGDS